MHVVSIAVTGIAFARSVQANNGMLESFGDAFEQVNDAVQPISNDELDAIANVTREFLLEAASIVGDKVDTVKYDTIGWVTGRYYCSPGYCTFPPDRGRSLLQQSSRCVACGINAYCPGGFQTLDNPNRIKCPTPTAGSDVVEFTTNGVTTASSRDGCLATCLPGDFAFDHVYGPCNECGYGYYCPGGVQTSLDLDRIPCPDGTNTTVPNASSKSQCVEL